MHDLRVIPSQNLSLNYHITKLISNTSKSSGFMLCESKNFSNIETFTLFNVPVSSNVEYADVIWNHYNIYSQQIDYIQKLFFNDIAFKQDVAYLPRGCDYLHLCQPFGVITPAERRIISTTMFLFKNINNFIDPTFMFNLINIRVPRLLSRNN